MKKLFVLFCLFAAFGIKAQAPQFLNYQGIARDASGNILTNPIGVKFEVVQGSASGTVVYDETHTVIPSSAGIFTAAIGGGSIGFGNFSTISWGTNSYFLRVSIDPAGGTSYSTVGTSQLLSVPYALYAEKAGNTQTVNIAGPNVTGSYPNYTITAPGPLTASTGISISGGTITNTAPDQPVSITGLGSTTVSGVYPNFTISTPSASTVPASTLQINPPHSITNLGPNNNSITIQPTNISGPNVIGSYPNYTIGPGAAPNIIGTGVTNVMTAGNNYTVNTPPVNMTYIPSTGVLSYSPAIGPNTVNISPVVSFAGGVLTVGPSVVTIPGTGVWTRPTASVTTLTNANDNVGIGTSTPNTRLHVVEAVNGIAAVRAINTYTTASNPIAMGIWAESNNPHGTSAGVYGVHNGGGNGVTGISGTTSYSSTAGVYGYAAGTSSTNVSIQADAAMGNSTGIFANSFPGHNGIALYALKAGSAGNAAKVEISNTTNSADALLAITNGQGAAIHAVNGPTVTGSSNIAMLLENGHIKTIQSVKPTIVTSTGLGAGSSCSINGNGTDMAGEILLNTGTLASGPPYYLVQVTFNKPLSATGSAVIILTARSPQTAGLQLFATPNGNTGFWVGTNNTPGSFTNYQLFYYVIER